MGAAADIPTALLHTSGKKDVLRQAFGDLETQKEAITLCTEGWRKLDEHLCKIEAALENRYQEIVEQEKALDARMAQTQESLDKRESSITGREQASLARVQEQKEAAVAAIREQKRKWTEERQRLESLRGETHTSAEKKREGKNETDSRRKSQGTEEASKKSDAAKVQKSSAKVDNSVEEDDSDDAGKKKDFSKSTDGSKLPVRVRPQLRSLCENMDGVGLRQYVAEQKKEINVLRQELPLALKCAADPFRIVLKALEGYHSTGTVPNAGQGKKTYGGPSANRRACILLLESLAELVDGPGMPNDIKELAKQVAESWKTKLSTGGSEALAFLDAQSFLQLLATFQLAAGYDKDELTKLVLSVARRKQTPALCRSLGLVAKVPDMVESLIKDGKQIEAVSFIHEFGLSRRFPPVPLLKAYLKDIKKDPQPGLKNGSEDKNELFTKELAALKAVLKCIDECNLGAEYPPEGLQKRVSQLEKKKLEKKRGSDAIAVTSKQPRVNGAGNGPQEGPAFSKPQFGTGTTSSYGQNYGLGYSGGARGAYAYQPDASSSIYGSSYSHQYGGGPTSFNQ